MSHGRDGDTLVIGTAATPRHRGVVRKELEDDLGSASILSEYVHNLPPSYREDPEGNLVQLLQPSGGA